MKKIAVLFILISFSARPVYQLGYLAYYELNIEYITDMYCVNKDKPEMHCNGKCHLMNQLAVGAAPGKNVKSVHVIEAFYPVYFQDYAYNYSHKALSFSVIHNWPLPRNQHSRFLNVPVPPPKV